MTKQGKPTIAVCITSLGADKKALKKFYKGIEPFSDRFNVVLDQRVEANDAFGSRSIDDRIDSLNWAFSNGDIVMAWDGGFNSIELLDRFDDIKTNSKSIFVGYSDNTLLVNAFASKGKCRTLYGPMMDDVVNKAKLRETLATNLLSLYEGDLATASAQYGEGSLVVARAGNMTGKIWGGNNYTFDLLQGTQVCPSFQEPFILFMEGENILKKPEYVWRDFIRSIDSIMLLPGARENIRGLIIGSFPASYRLRNKDFKKFIDDRPWLARLPLIYDFPCGHNKNSLYLLIGETVSLKANSKNKISISNI